jgi:hypothetical protein
MAAPAIFFGHFLNMLPSPISEVPNRSFTGYLL